MPTNEQSKKVFSFNEPAHTIKNFNHEMSNFSKYVIYHCEFRAYWNMINAEKGLINATIGTGMPHLSPYSDHYLHFEASNLPWNATAALFSPVYDKEQSQNACFSFQFSMNGANMGSLSLYLMPENDANFDATVNYHFFFLMKLIFIHELHSKLLQTFIL